MAFGDNILIYSNDLTEHRKYLCAAIKSLKEAGLYRKVEQCKFDKTENKY
jgi:hypothetical protein